MRILIVGAGVVGSNLAEELSNSGHDVSIVDSQPALVRQISDRMDVMAIQGNGAQPSVLRRAGIDDSEMVIAVTDVDEVNLVICMLASRFGVKHKIARLRNDEYYGPDAALVPAELGIDTVINPEWLITSSLRRILAIPGSTDVASFADGRVFLVTFDVGQGAPLAGKRLSELNQVTSEHNFLIVAIFRDEMPLVPRGDDTIRCGDHIVVVTLADRAPALAPLVQAKVMPTERVVIYGATLIGIRLAKALQSSLERVVLIEPDADLAEQAASELEETLVLHGHATDPEVLSEADTVHADYFLSLSRDDESNLLAALMARRLKARQVAVLAQEPHYVPVLNNIGLDVVLNPRLVTVGEILRYIRRGHVHTVTRLRDSEAEVLELEAGAGSAITQRKLQEIDFPPGAIVGAVMRDGRMLIPDGSCQIAEGETVLIFALPDAIGRIEKLFAQSGLITGLFRRVKV